MYDQVIYPSHCIVSFHSILFQLHLTHNTASVTFTHFLTFGIGRIQLMKQKRCTLSRAPVFICSQVSDLMYNLFYYTYAPNHENDSFDHIIINWCGFFMKKKLLKKSNS